MPIKYKRIPIEVEAMQVGIPFKLVAKWCDGYIYMEGPAYIGITIKTGLKKIETAYAGEWIIKFPEGNFIILSDELFKANYESTTNSISLT